jgi:hypothetical protein
MSDFKNSLAYLIANQVPDYVRTEFPQFVLFLEKYYEFLDQDGEVNNVLLNAASFSDINNTLDAFLPSFREQYLQMFPQDSLVDDRRLIKFIREFYEAKGSEESIHFIFRTFFDEHVEIIYPSEYILKASDGVWKEGQKLRITTDDTITLDPFALQGKRATIYAHKNIGNIATYDYHSITVETVTRLGYATQPTYELYVKHEENDYILLPGAGASARLLVEDGEILAVTGDPATHARDFNTDTDFSYDYAWINIPSHGFTTGDCVIYDPMGGEVIGGTVAYRQYYVKVIDVNYIRLYRDKIALSQPASKKFITSNSVDITYNKITIANHGYITGDMIIYYADATAIGGLQNGKVYYVIKIDANTIKLAESLIDSDPRYCSEDFFAADYVTITSYSEVNLTSQGEGNYHVLSKEYFINFTEPDTASDQRIIDAMDATGSGYNALPEVVFISDGDGIGATATAHLNDSGGIEYVSIDSGGTGYDDTSTVVEFNTNNVRSFLFIDELANKYGYVSRSITDTVTILSHTGTPNYGFKAAEIYSITEAGSAGQFVYTYPDTSLNYFAGDYVKIGIDNNASVIIDAVDTNGLPTKVRIFSSGGGFEAETFTATITSKTGAGTVTLGFTTGAITSIQDGYQNRQGMLSDINRLQDNYYYQNYSYVLRSRVPSSNWMTMIKNTVHPVGMAVFSELLIMDTLDIGVSFEVSQQPIDFYEFFDETITMTDTTFAVTFTKVLSDSISAPTDTKVITFRKVLSDSITAPTDTKVITFGKVLSDSIVAPTDTKAVTFSKVLSDSVTITESLLIGQERDFDDTSTPTDSKAISFGKTLSDSITAPTDAALISFGKSVSDSITAPTDAINSFVVGKVLTDAITPVEAATVTFGKTLSDSITAPTDAAAVAFGKTLSDSITAPTDAINSFVVGKNVSDSITAPTDAINSFVVGKNVSDSITAPTDAAAITFGKTLSDTINSPTDAAAVTVGKTLSDSITAPTDAITSFNVGKTLSDSITTPTDAAAVTVGKTLSDSTTPATETSTINIGKVLSDSITSPLDAGSINIQNYWAYNYTSGQDGIGDYVGTDYTF